MITQSIPFSNASFLVQNQVVAYVQRLLATRFPNLTLAQWQRAVRDCVFTVEVEQENIWLEVADMRRLATYLTVFHTDALELEPEAHTPTEDYLSRKVLYLLQLAATARQQMQAEPTEAYEIMRLALENIPVGDTIAEQVRDAFAFHKPSKQDAAELPATSPSPSLGVPANPRRKRAVEELPAQWDHLQAWFRRSNIPARPWNISEVAKQLYLTQSVVRALLMAPKGTPGYSRTAFNKTRLQLLQRYFAPYGYVPL